MKRTEVLVDLGIFTLILIFFLAFFTPKLLFSLTTTSGGDMGSHYPTAVYLKEVLFPHRKIMGWLQGNYAGFPLFYHYFPLTFIFIALLSYIIPMQIAFKLITVAGVFLMPAAVYLAFRLLRYPFPIPIIGAIFSLPFLFMEANSMWGGNIPSTLAGEFSYGFSLMLTVLLFGTLYRGIEEKKWIIFNAFLIAMIGLSHGYTLILSGVIGTFFFFTHRHFWENVKYLCMTFGLGFLLFAFWFIPFFGSLPYITDYVTRWHIGSIFEVIPRVLFPFFAFSLFSFFLNLFDRRTLYFAYIVLACLLLYWAGPSIGMLDIRFIPFVQLFVTIFSATFPFIFLKQVKSPALIPAILFLAVILWVAGNVSFTRFWIKWNYEGVEGKSVWPLFHSINDYLSQTNDGRVVYEHSPAHNIFGTERAFENLPYFAKRNTLEGLYMQSSISSPFIFYIQSEISKVCSGPFPQYTYSQLNLPAALPQLKIYNVTQYIARSPEAKGMARAIPQLKLEKVFGDYEIYRLLNNDGHYVVPLGYEPVRYVTADWKRGFFNWFRDDNLLPTHLVYVANPTAKDLAHFKFQSPALYPLPKVAIPLGKYSVKEEIKPEEIDFDTTLVGFPHLVKVSYHPNWKVEGADKIYLISPSFMLVYPAASHVRLYFGKTAYNHIGETLTLIGLIIVSLSGIISLVHARKK